MAGGGPRLRLRPAGPRRDSHGSQAFPRPRRCPVARRDRRPPLRRPRRRRLDWGSDEGDERRLRARCRSRDRLAPEAARHRSGADRHCRSQRRGIDRRAPRRASHRPRRDRHARRDGSRRRADSRLAGGARAQVGRPRRRRSDPALADHAGGDDRRRPRLRREHRSGGARRQGRGADPSRPCRRNGEGRRCRQRPARRGRGRRPAAPLGTLVPVFHRTRSGDRAGQGHLPGSRGHRREGRAG